MADSAFEERTLAPTPRRIQQARQEGKVVISRDLSSAVAMVTASTVFLLAVPAGVAGLFLFMCEVMRTAAGEIGFAPAAKHGLGLASQCLAVPLGALWVVACMTGVAQTRGLVTSLPLRPSARRALPALSRVLGREQFVEAAKGLLGLVALLVVAYWSIRPALAHIAGLGGAGPAQILAALGVLVGRLAMHLTLAMVVLGVADYLWQHKRHGRALRMGQGEARREHKESEGEPAHKAERLRLHHEFMNESSLAEVADADVVVLHAGVLAVVIRYDRARASAPVVVLRGELGRVQGVVRAARLAGVPVLDDPELARALATVVEGAEIPEPLYESVAVCLVRVQVPDQGGS